MSIARQHILGINTKGDVLALAAAHIGWALDVVYKAACWIDIEVVASGVVALQRKVSPFLPCREREEWPQT
jgi:hypothetical protein